jgi:hypothetical protein
MMLKNILREPENWLSIILEDSMNLQEVLTVRYHCGGWSEEVNSCILILSYMVYS